MLDMQDELALAGFTDGHEYLWEDLLKELEEMERLGYLNDDWDQWDSSDEDVRKEILDEEQKEMISRKLPALN